MKDEDIVGKEFTAVEFGKTKILSCNDSYKPLLGKIGVVTNINAEHSEYARVKFKVDGYANALHWPVKVIKEQIQYKETPEYTKNLFKEILNLTKTK